MSEKLGPRWHDIGEGQWQHEETGRIVEGDDEGPFVPIDDPHEPLHRLIPEATYQAMLTNIDYREKFERLGAAGEAYFAEQRATIAGLRAALAEKDAEIERLQSETSRLEHELAALLRHGIGVAGRRD